MTEIRPACLLAACIAAGAASAFADEAPTRGYVPTAPVAVAMAEAVLATIHGADTVAMQRPFTAELQNGTWLVIGTGPVPSTTGSTIHVTMGGQLSIRVDKATGAVLETGWLKWRVRPGRPLRWAAIDSRKAMS